SPDAWRPLPRGPAEPRVRPGAHRIALGIGRTASPLDPAALLDDHLAVHDHPMTGERAEIRVAARLLGGAEVDGELLLRPGDIRVDEDVVGLRNVVAHGRVGLSDDLVDQVS